MIFLHASVLLAAEDSDDANHHAARALLRTGAIGTIDLALYEVTNIAEVGGTIPKPAAAFETGSGRSWNSEPSSGSTAPWPTVRASSFANTA